MPRLRHGLLLTLLSLLLWAAAAWLRLRVLDHVELGSDSLSPYLQALGLRWDLLQQGSLPRPPNPESGDWLWLSAVPLVHAARSLEELFTLRFVLGAAIAPLGAVAAFVWAADDGDAPLLASPRAGQWAAALCAGVVLAVDPGLSDTLVNGARAYGAPELLTLVTLLLGLAWRGHPWPALFAAAALVVATGHHPLAFGAALGVALLLPGLGERLDLSDLGVAAAVALVFALPRIVRLVSLVNCGDDPLSCLSVVATSNVEDDVALREVIERAFNDRYVVELGLEFTAGLGLGLLLCRPWTGAGLFGLGAVLGIVAVGMVTGYLRSYHLRMLAGPLTVAASVGLARLWPLALAWAGVAGWFLVPKLPVGPDPGALARHEQVAEAILERGHRVWVDRAWWGPRVAMEPSAVVLSGILRGAPRERFAWGPDVPMVLLAVGVGTPAPPADAVIAEGMTDEGTPWAAVLLPDRDAARRWVDGGEAGDVRTGGAFDWVGPLYGPQARPEQLDW